MFKGRITSEGFIRSALGVLWIIDGLLQLQPHMFTRSFADRVLAPAAVGQPGFLSGPMYFLIKVILSSPGFFNLIFALIQLSIGVMILIKNSRRRGLIASAVWALIIWIFAEGLGGILVPGSMILTGAPGAALLYAAISLALLHRKDGDSTFPDWVNYLWAAFWLGGIVLIFFGNIDAKGLAESIVTANGAAPHWYYSFAYSTASKMYNLGSWSLLITVLLYATTGLLVFLGLRLRKAAVLLGIILALFIWIFGESFGALYSGIATDPNSAPLIILLGLMVLRSKQVSLDIA